MLKYKSRINPINPTQLDITMAARPSPAIIAEEMFLISIPSDDLTEEQINRIRVLARGILEEMHAGGLAAWPGPHL